MLISKDKNEKKGGYEQTKGYGSYNREKDTRHERDNKNVCLRLDKQYWGSSLLYN